MGLTKDYAEVSKHQCQELREAGYNVPEVGDDVVMEDLQGGDSDGWNDNGWESDEGEGDIEGGIRAIYLDGDDSHQWRVSFLCFCIKRVQLLNRKKEDGRNRRDRMKRENMAWREKRAAIANAVMQWEADGRRSMASAGEAIRFHNEIPVYSFDGKWNVFAPMYDEILTRFRH